MMMQTCYGVKVQTFSFYFSLSLSLGAEIWLDHVPKSQFNKLESFQHKILKNSIMAFKTTSKSCTICLTNIEPLKTHVTIRQTKFLIKHKNRPLPQHQTLTHYTHYTKATAINNTHTNTNDTFKKFFPTSPIPKFIHPNYYTTQFITGHGHFYSYLFRFKIYNTPYCICTQTPQIEQTPEHLLLHCPIYYTTKSKLNLHQITQLHQFTKNKTNYKQFTKLCKHIYTHLKTYIP